ncbi:MAG TPA: ATP-binding cassette domain-containing protein [Firmicutes bacterium]|uniref:ATP-binding cassette domain-containing protein n=1 Tax=Capillibacterium thermochitinicola TaxID=2699427 RepID=A0A8J6I3J4_9FIRM|nr:ATP-binding cassette domain-containing protein [Capillibacterium thermochitinicola]MBA2134004.1 ATP-binding cassette domain-containing protein [Capillibacterium thermochitinicola]HHW11432.1 ATP-binding cassette domain-containing protein [Bacillota bacterium]
MNSNSEMIIQAQNITKRFGGMVAVNNVTFGLKKNEVAGLIGANGAGKTTFFNILTGNYFPEEGKVYYKGEDITDLTPESRVDLGIMRTFQLASTFDNLKVIDNMRLAFYRANNRASLRNIFFTRIDRIVSEKIDECLETFGLTKMADRLTGNLSLGEKRILEIAMSIVTDPEVLLLDEPFAGLSDGEINECLDVLRQQVGKKTILIVEHKISKIENLVQTVGVMVEGVMIAAGETKATLNSERVRQEYWKTAQDDCY